MRALGQYSIRKLARLNGITESANWRKNEIKVSLSRTMFSMFDDSIVFWLAIITILIIIMIKNQLVIHN